MTPLPHRRDTAGSPVPAAAGTPHRWLLFVHQLPPVPSNLRVRTWRRLQQLGAIPIKQAVYVLPDTPEAREDFEWLKAEVKAAGGGATVFAADGVDPWSDDTLIEEFRRSRQDAYATLAGDIERVLGRISARRRPRGARAPAVQRLADGFRERLTALDRIDFFGSAGRDRVLQLITELDAHTRVAPPAATVSHEPADVSGYYQRVWVTRPRPGVDRMASAWLIRRFIDPRARFGFAADREAVPAGAVPFDMFGVEFSHQGEGCTFETLCARFALGAPALERVAAIVHDLDLKDGRYGAAETPTVATLIEGLQLATADDDELLERGMTLFESLYRSFERSGKARGPTPVAATRKRPRVTSRRRRSR